VAFSIGRRYGPAVARNRIRRRLRAVLRDLAPVLPPGAYLVGAAPDAARLSPVELSETVIAAVKSLPPETYA
jgi:ribonuclease P protein component